MATDARALLLLALGLVACPSPADRAPSDAGPRDAPRLRDAAGDVGRDTGPPPDPVLPPQFWEATIHTNGVVGELVLRVSIVVDARAESGSVRVFTGANGSASAGVFDVVEPGVLVARTPIELGIMVPPSDCGFAATIRIPAARLAFDDLDHDGVHETLNSVTGDVFSLDQAGNVVSTSAIFVSEVVADTRGPTLTLVPARPLSSVETLQLFSSEPLDPRAVPYVDAGGRRFGLRETPGSRGSHWAIELSSLPLATGYALHFDGDVLDLAGNPAATLPETTFDVTTPEVLVLDGFESGLTGITAEGEARLLTTDEGAIEGSTSAFTMGRTVIVLAPPPTARGVTFAFRVFTTAEASVAPWVRARTPDGRVVGYASLGAFSYVASAVPGLPFQSDVSSTGLSFPTDSDRILVEIEPTGPSDPTCVGMLPPGAAIGMALDSFTFF
jgi:hypothetical protein